MNKSEIDSERGLDFHMKTKQCHVHCYDLFTSIFDWWFGSTLSSSLWWSDGQCWF